MAGKGWGDEEWGDTSSEDQQGQIGSEAEYKEQQFEEPKVGVCDDVKGIAWNGEPFALDAIDEVRREPEKQWTINENSGIDNGAPHEKGSERLDRHGDNEY